MKKDVKQLRELAGGDVDIAIVLGSGLSAAIDDKATFKKQPFPEFEGMPRAVLKGHSGQVLGAKWHDKRVIAFAGRVHLYQGFSAEAVTYGVRLAHRAGAKTLIVTNAAGGLNHAFSPGDLMLISDQLNFTGHNPLVGSKLKNPFIDMSDCYAPHLRQIAKHAANAHGGLREGVYAGVLGPTYETPAESRYLRISGADAVGMSTVLETIQARALGMFVLGLSLITNMVGPHPTTHDDVMSVGKKSAPRLADILDGVIASV